MTIVLEVHDADALSPMYDAHINNTLWNGCRVTCIASGDKPSELEELEHELEELEHSICSDCFSDWEDRLA